MWDNSKIAGYFKKFAEVFSNLGGYKLKLMREMEETGLPIVRSLALEFDMPQWTHIDDQFMLGSDILVAPIFERDQTSRKVFFPYIGPTHHWQHYFTGDVITVQGFAGRLITVKAPLGMPAAFKRVSLPIV